MPIVSPNLYTNYSILNSTTVPSLRNTAKNVNVQELLRTTVSLIISM